MPAIFAAFPWMLTNAFSTNYLPHGFCFAWNPRLLWLHVVADAIIWLSYTAIAGTLALFVAGTRRLIRFQSIFFLFGTFIVACGFTHLLDVVVLWQPLYWLQGDLKLLTACASLITAVALPFCIPQVKAVLSQAAESAENGRRFLAAAESSLDSLYLLDAARNDAGEIVDFRFSFVNGNAARLVGSSPERLIGNLLCESMPQNHDRGFFDSYKKVAETGIPHVEEFAVDGFQGVTAEWIKIQVVQLGDGVAVTCSDISERKRLEAERDAAFAESLIDKVPAAVVLTGPDYSIRGFNPAASAMLQYQHTEIAQLENPPLLLHASGLEALAVSLSKDFGTVVTTHESEFEDVPAKGAVDLTFLRKDGSTVVVEASMTALKGSSGELTGYMFTAHDISERKRREEEAANAKSQIEAIHRSQMAIEFDMDGVILQANENYLAPFGYTPAEVVGRHHGLFVEEEYRESAEYREFWAQLKKGQFRAGEFKRIAKDGSEVWVEASYNPVFGRKGVPVRVAKFAMNITDRVSLQRTIADAENHLRAIVNSVVDGIVTIDGAGAITSVNRGVTRMFEYAERDLVGVNVKMLMPQSDAEVHDGHLALYRSNGKSKAIGVARELQGLTKSGRLFPVEVTITEVSLHGNRLFVALVRDITEQRRAEEENRRTRDFTESLIAHSPAAVIVTDAIHTIVSINPAAEKMLWYKPEELIGLASPLSIFDPEQVASLCGRLSSATGAPVNPEEAIFSAFPGRDPGAQGEWKFRRKGGSAVDVQVAVTPLSNERKETFGYMITAYDVTERKRREEYISHLANHDALTGLPTRQLLLDRLKMMLSRCDRFGTTSALMMVDLNGFKQINDRFGHHVGDRLLAQVAERLQSAVRKVDTVARMGGDEFVVLVADLESAEGVGIVAEKLLDSFRKPFVLSDQSKGSVGASIGVCVYPGGGEDADALLRNADLAMYHAKATKGHRYRIFDKGIERVVLQQRDMTAALSGALSKGELELQYQPQFSLADGSLVGVEALLRWKSGDFGPVSPARFIPVAEESGLILPIGEWVIETACQELAGLQRRFGARLVMAVNISARQLDQAGLLEVVQKAAKANSLDPASIEVEITESLLMSDTPHAFDFFEGLRKMGARVAIDDFGTGFSSMSYLLRYSVDRLKIDRCFIEDCCSNANSAAITSAVIALAHQLKVSVLAEVAGVLHGAADGAGVAGRGGEGLGGRAQGPGLREILDPTEAKGRLEWASPPSILPHVACEAPQEPGPAGLGLGGGSFVGLRPDASTQSQS